MLQFLPNKQFLMTTEETTEQPLSHMKVIFVTSIIRS